MKKVLSPFFNPYIGPILVISLIILSLVLFVIPNYSQKNQISQMTIKAEGIIKNLKDIRSYYTHYVIREVKKGTDLKINYDHAKKENTIPLPATLVHNLSKIVPEQNMEIKMFSNYPFPNRKDRVLDDFEKESLSWLINNPEKIYTKTILNKNDEKIFKVAVADVFNNPSCVSCHNTRADTPKNDWKLGDVRGIIEITMPYKKEFILSGNETIILIALLILVIFVLGVHYTVMSFIRQKDHSQAKALLEKEVKERTESLRESNKLLNEYKKAVDISTIVSKTNRKGKITYVNDEFVKVSGYDREELIGRSHNIVRHEDMPNSVFKDLWTTINNKQIWKGQIKNKAKDGSSYYVASTIVPILNYKNEIEEFLAIRLDITEVIEAQQKAQKADDAKSTFLANMSHEIRTPLNAIIGFSDILCESKALDVHGVKQARIINSSANSLLSIINDILDISKIESGNFDITIDKTDLYFISEHVVELFSTKATEKHIKLVFNLDHKIPMCILTDGVRIRQVLSNLLSNAIKFTPKHGKVQISINTLETKDSKTKVRFEVSDTGIGIPKDKIDNVFKPFMQVDHKSNREFEGTGLGLSICTHIVDSLGSKINIESDVGSGTRFWFDLTLDTCSESIHTNKEYLSHLNFIISDTSSDLYHYIKRYLSVFGSINISNDKTNDILICSSIEKSQRDIEIFRDNNCNKPTLVLFEYEEEAKNFKAKDNEYALALPFYASKVNDALQELQKKTGDNLAINKDGIDEKFNGKILVAEDNTANQELISYVLESFGVNYQIEDNGKETLEAFKNGSFDLILMDINMPVMDGIEAFHHIRDYEKQNALGTIPIIALTANAVKGDKERFLEIGMNEYLSKPINTSELRHLFSKFLNPSNNIDLDDNSFIKNKIDVLEKKSSIDTQKVINKLGVSENIALMIINKFKKEIEADIQEFKILIEKDDTDGISNKAHYIKNSCLNVALDEACEILQKLEDKTIEYTQKTKLFKELESIILSVLKA